MLYRAKNNRIAHAPGAAKARRMVSATACFNKRIGMQSNIRMQLMLKIHLAGALV
jgi:hypothetical protein